MSCPEGLLGVVIRIPLPSGRHKMRSSHWSDGAARRGGVPDSGGRSGSTSSLMRPSQSWRGPSTASSEAVIGEAFSPGWERRLGHQWAGSQARASARASAGADVAPPPAMARDRGRAMPSTLEEPYVLQPTAAVFEKLHELLVRSLARLRKSRLEKDAASRVGSSTRGDGGLGDGGREGAVVWMVLSLLLIMRANFCRLVEAHVDPLEMGFSLGQGKRCRAAGGGNARSWQRGGDGSLLPRILSTLQAIMLDGSSERCLLRSAVDTFSSGLSLLMPSIEDRLHLLLGLVRHLKASRKGVPGVAGGGVGEVAMGNDSAGVSPAGIPRERVTLLRNLLRHFSRTESVLELLALFEEDESQRDAVSDLLELMLSSMAHRASGVSEGAGSLGGDREVEAEEGLSSVSRSPPSRAPSQAFAMWSGHGSAAGAGASVAGDPRDEGDGGLAATGSQWEVVVAGASHQDRLSFNFLETCQQHLLYMVLNRDRAQANPHELLLCQYGQCLLQVRLQ